jgi:hypothetical protein
MKITAIKKNRDKKVSRAEFFGSNPHSNGDLFSRSSLIFFETCVASTIISDDNKVVTIAVVIIISIIYLVFHKFLDWKSNLYMFRAVSLLETCRGQ